MTALLHLTREFTKHSARKTGTGMVDFHDLEQHALRLLWESLDQPATVIAAEWRRKLSLYFRR